MSITKILDEALSIVGSTRKRPETVRTSRKFRDDFEIVAARYKLRELGEYDEAKDAARRDMADAEICFAAMALEED